MSFNIVTGIIFMSGSLFVAYHAMKVVAIKNGRKIK